MDFAEFLFLAALLCVFPAAVIYAGASDLVSMTISNRVTLGLVAAFAILAVWAGMPMAVVGDHVLAGVAMLVLGLGLFAPGWIGGGDAKLCAATALWLGWDLLLEYAVVASLLGGGLTLGILVFRRMPLTEWLIRQDWLARLHHRDTGIPYGIALAAAALIIYTRSYWFTGTLG